MIYLAPQLVLRTSEQPAPREYTVSTAPTEYKAVAEQSPPHRSQRAEPRRAIQLDSAPPCRANARSGAQKPPWHARCAHGATARAPAAGPESRGSQYSLGAFAGDSRLDLVESKAYPCRRIAVSVRADSGMRVSAAYAQSLGYIDAAGSENKTDACAAVSDGGGIGSQRLAPPAANACVLAGIPSSRRPLWYGNAVLSPCCDRPGATGAIAVAFGRH